MNLDNHVNSIVQDIVKDITDRVQTQVASIINQQVSDTLAKIDTNAILLEQLGKKIDARLSQLPIDPKSIEAKLANKLDKLTDGLSNSVQEKAVSIARESIVGQVNKIDFQQLCQATLASLIQGQDFSYPLGSIPGEAIDTSSLSISGDNVSGGIIKNFGSTGIDDKATGCQLSIFDETTVVENNLLTKDLTVKGTATIEGDLIVTGTVPKDTPLYQNLISDASEVVRASFNQSVFGTYADLVTNKIKNEGLDLNRILLNGKEVISGSNLATHITYSNLQKVGQLVELQVAGESLLSGSLYTTQKRVGINTIEPNHALSVWDQEVEIGFGKKTDNTAILGTPRNQTLILSSNGKQNISLTPDGEVKINKINLEHVSISSSPTPPANDQPIGSIVFNANPSLGGPLGWVSLGGARWANFGIID